MVVMTPRESWTDGRLDEFKENVNHRFDEVDRRFDEVDKRFEQVDKRFDAVDARFDRFETQMHADMRELRQSTNQLHHTMVVGFIGLAGLIASAAIFF